MSMPQKTPLPLHIVIDLQGAQSESRHRGIGRYAEALALSVARLAQGRHRVSLLLSAAFADTIEPICKAFADLIAPADFLIWEPLTPCHALDERNAWRRAASEALYSAYIRSLQVDALLITSLFEGQGDDAVSAISGDLGMPLTAVVVHDLIPLLQPETYLTDPLRSAWYHKTLAHLRLADLLLANSASTAQETLDYLDSDPARVVTISSAADARFRVLTLDEGDAAQLYARYGLQRPFVLYTGAVDPRKNIEALISAYASLPKELRSRHQLAVVYSITEHDRARLSMLAVRAGLAKDELIFTGYVPCDDLVALYNLCALFMFPSLQEGFGLPTLEAMACGAPTLASNRSSLPEVVGWDEALFDPDSVCSMAAAMERGLTDTDYRAALKAHGLQQAQRFSWEATAQRALDAIEVLAAKQSAERGATQPIALPQQQSKPLLAYVSPLQPAQSGIAHYSAELLPELAAHYDIEVIVAQDEPITDPWVLGNARQRSMSWFEANAQHYDRVLYHIGNSPYHQHMVDLLDRIPGVVVLHDFFLGNIYRVREHTGMAPGAWSQALLHAHGWKALQHRAKEEEETIVDRWPCNLAILQRALGVIVHGQYLRQLTEQWYGNGFADDLAVIPLLRAPMPRIEKARCAARSALRLRDDDILVCSFGLLGKSKLNHRLLDAWQASGLAKDERCHLVFVGQAGGDYGAQLQQQIRTARGRISITGWVDEALYRRYLAAANMAVQLREKTDGESMGAMLDCMNAGIATIVNANGSMAELPCDAVWMLAEEFQSEDLVNALETLRSNPARCGELGTRAYTHIRAQHQPRGCAAQYQKAIEGFYGGAERGLLALTKQLGRVWQPSEPRDLALAAARAAEFIPSKRPMQRQLLVDISELCQRDAKSGIQRVVRSVLHVLLARPPEGFRVEPVYATAEQGYRYARCFTARFLELRRTDLDDAPVFALPGDVFWGVDLQSHIVPLREKELRLFRLRGVKVVFTVYDLLPIFFPETFGSGATEGHSRWLRTLTSVSDGLIAISEAVNVQLKRWLALYGPRQAHAVKLGWAHLGADVVEHGADKPASNTTVEQSRILVSISRHPAFLMVGTLEPRKAQSQALAAFDLLWSQGEQVNLVIVGKQGWLMDELAARLRSHPLRERHLFWLEGIDDALLEQVYAASTCLIAASLDEGYGLPLIEAARHKLPILARDIPVFREVAGAHASYFAGTAPRDLADAVQAWLRRHDQGQFVPSDSMPWMNWAQATRAMLDVILQDQWQDQWQPQADDTLVARYWGSDPRLFSVVGEPIGTALWSTGKAGYLLHGPYLNLAPGRYVATLTGRVGPAGLNGACANVCHSLGTKIVTAARLEGKAQAGEQTFARMEFTLAEPVQQLEVRLEVEPFSDLAIAMVEIRRAETVFPEASVSPAEPIHTEEKQPVIAYWATHPALYSQVGYAAGRRLYSTGKSGYLLVGPYTSLPAGSYRVVIFGQMEQDGEVRVYVCIDKGKDIVVAKTSLRATVGKEDGILGELDFTLDHYVDDLEVRIEITAEMTEIAISAYQIFEMDVNERGIEMENFKNEKWLFVRSNGAESQTTHLK